MEITPENNWQPTLTGLLIRVRPMLEADFEELFTVASDPLIWEQHPDNERYKREVFLRFFQSGLESKGALVVVELKTGKIIGASRFCKPHPDEVPDLTGFEIGYTFLARAFWGNGYNEELKLLMLNHAFQFVDAVQFFIGEFNFRSQRAILKTGATYNRKITSAQLNGSQMTSLVYQLCKSDWPKYALALAASYL